MIKTVWFNGHWGGGYIRYNTFKTWTKRSKQLSPPFPTQKVLRDSGVKLRQPEGVYMKNNRDPGEYIYNERKTFTRKKESERKDCKKKG